MSIVEEKIIIIIVCNVNSQRFFVLWILANSQIQHCNIIYSYITIKLYITTLARILRISIYVATVTGLA